MNVARRWTSWPSVCEVCRQWSDSRLCEACRHVNHRRWRCHLCALPLAPNADPASGVAHASSVCGDCLEEPPPWDRVVCAVPYAFPWDQLIAGFKYHEQWDLATALAEVLARAVQQAHPHGPSLDGVIPMPMTPERLAKRGYNQAWELARRVAQRFKLPAQPCALMRTVTTAPQASLSRQARLSQLQGVFSLAPDERLALRGRRLALVDDVMTTGASARAAAQVLRQAGVASLEIWTLARTD